MPDTNAAATPGGDVPWWIESQPPAASAAPTEHQTDDQPFRWTVVLRDAVDAGFTHTAGDADRPWQRLSCPTCGDRLDLPSADDPGWIRYGVRAVDRVSAFVHRHRPGGEHR